MPIIEIADSGNSLSITENGKTRYVIKRHVRQVYVIEPSVVKLDTGDPLQNIYLKHSDVISPFTPNVGELRDLLNGMLKEDLTEINNQLNEISINIEAINSEIFVQALIIEQAAPQETFNGFALPGSQTSEPVWAIQKVTEKKGVKTYQWADGNKNFDKVWDDRKNLQYA